MHELRFNCSKDPVLRYDLQLTNYPRGIKYAFVMITLYLNDTVGVKNSSTLDLETTD
jgi:hypothetical protein